MQLRNVAFPPRPVTFHLEHQTFCATVGVCSCTSVNSQSTRYDPTTRKPIVDARRVMVPSTETVWSRGQPGDLSRALPRCVLDEAEVKAALSRGELVLEPAAAVAPNPAPTPDAAPPSPLVEADSDETSDPESDDEAENSVAPAAESLTTRSENSR